MHDTVRVCQRCTLHCLPCCSLPQLFHVTSIAVRTEQVALEFIFQLNSKSLDSPHFLTQLHRH